MLLLNKIIFLLQIKLFLNSVNCLKTLESNLVLDEKNDNHFNKELLEQVFGPNYKSAIEFDIKDSKPQVQVFTDDQITNNNNNNNNNKVNDQLDLTKYQNYLKQQNYIQNNYVPQHYNHQVEHNNYSNKMSPTATQQQKEIAEYLNTRNNHKRDNHNQIKKPCPGKKHKHNDEQPTPTYFYPKHTKGELVVHNPAPIIVKRPPTKVVVNHPAIVVRPQPVLINRTPQAINPVMVYRPAPAPPAEPLKIRPVFVKFESALPSSHPHHHHGGNGYPYRMPDHDTDHENDGIYGEGTNLNLNGSPYYSNDGQQPRYNVYNN